MVGIELNGIQAGFNERTIINGICLKLFQREITLLIGPNGCGKSTLLKAAFGLIKSASISNIVLNNQVLSQTEWIDFRKNFSYIPQYQSVFLDLSVEENLKVASLRCKNPTIAVKRTLSLIPSITPNLHKRAGNLSGGEKQVVAIAMGVMKEPMFLLIDEPLAGLDLRSLDLVLSIFENLKHESKISMLIAEHRFSKLLNIADKVVAINDGRFSLELNLNDNTDLGQVKRDCLNALLGRA